MPIAAAYMVYAGATATALGTATFAGVMAGAMLVGGAVSLVGTITGDKNLESDGMMVGTIGSLGMGLAGAGKAGEAAASTEGAAGQATTATSTIDPSSSYGKFAEGVSGGASGVQMGATAANTAQSAELVSKFSALESAQNMNLIGNVAQGVSTAYTGHEQKKMMEEQFNQKRADEQALIEERRRNMDLAGLKINTPTMPQIIKPGLINRPQQNPVTGSGQTMMQIK